MSTLEELKKLLEEKEREVKQLKDKYEPPPKKLGRPRGSNKQLYGYQKVPEPDRKKPGRKCLPVDEKDIQAFNEGRYDDISSHSVFRTLKYRNRYTRKTTYPDK